VEHNTQGLHTMERVISSSPYAFIYMCRLGPTLTTHMGQSQRDKVNEQPNTTFQYVLCSTFLRWSLCFLFLFLNTNLVGLLQPYYF